MKEFPLAAAVIVLMAFIVTMTLIITEPGPTDNDLMRFKVDSRERDTFYVLDSAGLHQVIEPRRSRIFVDTLPSFR
jgi:hypothetical protein